MKMKIIDKLNRKIQRLTKQRNQIICENFCKQHTRRKVAKISAQISWAHDWELPPTFTGIDHIDLLDKKDRVFYTIYPFRIDEDMENFISELAEQAGYTTITITLDDMEIFHN
jgi:hypothetical protein